MINVVDYPILQESISTLKEISIDTAKKPPEYMTNSTREAVNFDDVKSKYTQRLRLRHIPASNDALLVDGVGRPIFIEFKNGVMDKEKEHKVRKKVYDSMLMLSDITCKNIDYSRGNMDYILVYNEEKNPTDDDPKVTVQPSSSRDEIAKKISSLAGNHHIKFGLEMFKNYCFRDVFTFSKSEFDNYLENNDRFKVSADKILPLKEEVKNA